MWKQTESDDALAVGRRRLAYAAVITAALCLGVLRCMPNGKS